MTLIRETRKDLELPELKWYVSQQSPMDHKSVNEIDVMAELTTLLAKDRNTVHIKATDLPPQDRRLVIDTPGVVWLGKKMARAVTAEQPAVSK